MYDYSKSFRHNVSFKNDFRSQSQFLIYVEALMRLFDNEDLLIIISSQEIFGSFRKFGDASRTLQKKEWYELEVIIDTSLIKYYSCVTPFTETPLYELMITLCQWVTWNSCFRVFLSWVFPLISSEIFLEVFVERWEFFRSLNLFTFSDDSWFFIFLYFFSKAFMLMIALFVKTSW